MAVAPLLASEHLHDDSHLDPLRADDLDLLPRDLMPDPTGPLQLTEKTIKPAPQKPGLSRRNLLLGGGVSLLTVGGLAALVRGLVSSSSEVSIKTPLKTPADIKAKLDEYLSLKPSLYDSLLRTAREKYNNNGQKLSSEAVESFAVVSARLQFAYAMVDSGDFTIPEFWNALMSQESVFVPQDNPVVIQIQGGDYSASGPGASYNYGPSGLLFTGPGTCQIAGGAPEVQGSMTVESHDSALTFRFHGRDPHPSPEEIHEGRYELAYTPKLIIP